MSENVTRFAAEFAAKSVTENALEHAVKSVVESAPEKVTEFAAENAAKGKICGGIRDKICLVLITATLSFVPIISLYLVGEVS